MSQQPFEFTSATMAHLRACRAQGLTKVEACAELGTSTTTLDRAAKRADYYDSVRALFPHGGVGFVPEPDIVGGMRKMGIAHVRGLPLEIEWTPQVRWLTRSWRAGA